MTAHASYLNDPATHMLNTQCIVCSTPLRDAKSVELGIGPVCRAKNGFGKEIAAADRIVANRKIREAATAKYHDDIERVFELANDIEALGLDQLAQIIRLRFITVQLIDVDDGWFDLHTPYDGDFLGAMKAKVPWNQREAVRDPEKLNRNGKPKFKHWRIAQGSKRALLGVLARFWPGTRAMGGKGVFVIPTEEQFDKIYNK